MAILINIAFLSTTHANEEVDAEFLEFLADMEEATGTGFERWLEDDDEDTNIMKTNEIEQNTQSSEK